MEQTALTPDPSPTRRLAAVLIADVAGYSRLMERDEAGTHARLLQIRREVTDPVVLKHGGRIVRTVGDGLLVEFPSAASAFLAAIEIQRAMAARNQQTRSDERIDHRIGINAGDILIESNDIAGTGVNVAARLEALAPPGGIAISGIVREQVRHTPDVSFIDAGEQHVKNISQPVRVYTVQFDAREGNPSRWMRLRTSRWRRRVAFASAVLLTVVIAAVVALRLARHQADLSIAVLPFHASSEDSAIAANLTSEVSEAMTRVSGFTIVAPQLARRFEAQSGDITSVPRSLGADYVLVGRVDRSAAGLQLSTEIIDAKVGKTLWSGTFDATPPVAGQPPIDTVGPLMAAVRSQLRQAELKRLAGAETARAVTLRATADLINSASLADVRAVRTRFERALSLEPDNVEALARLADSLIFEARRTASEPERAALMERADAASLRAVTLDHDSPGAWGTRAQVLLARGQTDAALQAIEQALKLEPYDADLHSIRAQIALTLGDADTAIASLDKAIAINPRSNAMGVLLHYRCRAQLLKQQYTEAVASCQRGLAFVPDWSDYMLLAAAYAQLGDMDNARTARQELLRRNPQFTLAWYQSLPGVTPAAGIDAIIIAGLRKASIPQ
jgi:class 3 adenylate cyclase/TolB-like protein/Flp pilus assembly protein TadD